MLASVAGYVDAVGFVMTGGYFVSFMSGNSTRVGVGAVLDAPGAVIAAGLVMAFVAGVVAGASIRRIRRQRPEGAILAFLALTLAVCGYLAGLGMELPAALLLAFAMGAENTVFAGAGEVRVGLTYMTGALVKVGKGLAAALFGDQPIQWTAHLLLWLGLVGGAVLGASAYSRMGATAIWIAAAAVAVLSLLSRAIFPPAPGREGD